jgi:hypothetical protein
MRFSARARALMVGGMLTALVLCRIRGATTRIADQSAR